MKKLFIPIFSLLALAGTATAQMTTTKTKSKTAAKTTTTTEAAKPAEAGKTAGMAKKHTVKKHHAAAKKMAAEAREETITLDNSDDKTIVEIQAGGVYVNGDLVSTIADAKKESHKIIINNKEKKENAGGMKDTYPEVEIDEAPAHKALLGIFTADNGEDEGARVRSVINGSPADAAGLQNGDLIIKVSGMNIKNSADLVTAINDHSWGEMVSIAYMRNGHEEFTKADLGEVTLRRVPEADDYGDVPNRRGEMTLPDPFMRSYEKQYYDKLYDNDYNYQYTLKMGIVAENAENGKGVVVTSVKPGSPAEAAGLVKGDIILWLDHQRTRSVDDIHLVLSYSWPNERVKLVLKRDGEMMVTHMFLAKQTFKKSL